MPMERRLPAQENTLEDLIATMMANRTSELKKQEEETARVSEGAGLAPDADDDADDAADADDDAADAADAADSADADADTDDTDDESDD
ncbi:MAG: hypothetical protein FWC54_00415 [Actinomycetia bacterium]|nr:hypothetical protein [Actinomycetes bacterium]